MSERAAPGHGNLCDEGLEAAVRNEPGIPYPSCHTSPDPPTTREREGTLARATGLTISARPAPLGPARKA